LIFNNHVVTSPGACSFGWWLMAGAGLFWEKSTASWLLVVDLLWEKSIAGWWLISQANRALMFVFSAPFPICRGGEFWAESRRNAGSIWRYTSSDVDSIC
jgi:hypothetical protein